jgi:hypothetical protein
MPTKTWAVGEEVLAADFNAYVQRQVVATFANAAARNTALPSPTVGMVVHLADTGELLLATTTTTTGWVPVDRAGRRLARAQIIAPSVGFSTGEADVAGLTITYQQVAGRRYVHTVKLEISADQGGGHVFVVKLTDQANAQKDRLTGYLPTTSGQSFAWSQMEDATVTATVTRKLRCVKATGTGWLTIGADPAYPAYIEAVDGGVAAPNAMALPAPPDQPDQPDTPQPKEETDE